MLAARTDTRRRRLAVLRHAGSPQGEPVQIVERFSLNDEQTELAFRVTVTDATTFTVPAVIEGKWLARGDTIARYDCQPAQ